MSEQQAKQTITLALRNFGAGNFAVNALSFFKTLGYQSEKQVTLSPNTAENVAATFNGANRLNPKNALLDEWKSVDLLFQLTGDEITNIEQGRLSFESSKRIDDTIIESYLFFAVDLHGRSYTRTQLAGITREINKLFPMPVMVLFRHGQTLTLSIINRRLHKRDESKDVLEKVTLVKDIAFANPHRAHLEILFDLSLAQLFEKHGFANFVELHNAWQKTLDSSELNKRFFREVANWYFWAVRNVKFPKGAGKNAEARNDASVIRLITRLIFVWFIKEKGLVPEELFNQRKVEEILKFADPKQSTYYKAILQNLFFATLNTEMNTAGKPDNRKFRSRSKQAGGRDQHHMIHNVYRYREYFKKPDEALQMFAVIPFLNGGLFECLDKEVESNGKKVDIRIDGFSDRTDNELKVPDFLFFAEEQEVDLNDIYDTRNKLYKVRGLINIFDSYKFTVNENTPIEEEVALDPELLGKVFENLLAAYNPETGVTARKQTGSFYTPREIVNYMVDESLIAYFESKLGQDKDEMRETNNRLRHLLAYNDEPHRFSPQEITRLIEAIDTLKILDPACGSGAFPMGILHKLVFILAKLDPGNQRWKEKQIAKANEIPDSMVREKVVADIEQAFGKNELDYGRKLYLIENCIYGVDIQPIAVQIAKLRFFISLVVDQKMDEAQENRGIRPLPNLETKFVAANTLMGIEKPVQLILRNPDIDQKEKELAEVRRNHFIARTPKTKTKYRELDAKLRAEISDLLLQDGFPRETTHKLAYWDPYDQNASADFFDTEWMFGVDGFNITIGNPPYVRPHKLSTEIKQQLWKLYSSFEKKSDLYCCFIEKSLAILKQNGMFAFIVSNGFLRLDSFYALRKLLLQNASIRKIVDYEGDVFESATVKTCILIFSRHSSDDNEIQVAQIAPATELQYVTFKRVPQKHFETTYKSIFDLSSNVQIDRIKEKIVRGTQQLGSIFEISFGLKTGDDDKFLSFKKSSRDHKPLLRGEDIGRYFYEFKGEYVWYVPDEMTAHKSTARPGIKDRFEQPKVLMRDTGDGLIGTFDDKNFYVKDVLIISDKKKRVDILKYLLALLNSTLMKFYYETSFPTLHVQRNELASLPIKFESSNQSSIKAFSAFVDQILAAKRANPAADVSALEGEIDQLVYRLYGLTAEEIAIVEEAERRK
ncbi:N-6 DNA methylase [candidate division KSB1 bacterium]|nr:N-6 DNA methylase [candidate division KSB1 bacterium]